MIQIVMPTYNMERFLAETLDSIIDQTYTDWILLIVDDGSTDSTSEIIKNYVRQDSRIESIYQSNQGICHARNNGFEHLADAKPYTLFADADDLYEIDAFMILVQTAARRFPNPVVGGMWRRIDVEGSLEKETRSIDPHIDVQTLEAILEHPILLQTPSCYLTRTDWIHRVGPFDPEYTRGAEDWDFWLRLAALHTIDLLYTDISRYRRVEGSLSSTEISRVLADQVVQKHKDLYLKRITK